MRESFSDSYAAGESIDHALNRLFRATEADKNSAVESLLKEILSELGVALNKLPGPASVCSISQYTMASHPSSRQRCERECDIFR